MDDHPFSATPLPFMEKLAVHPSDDLLSLPMGRYRLVRDREPKELDTLLNGPTGEALKLISPKLVIFEETDEQGDPLLFEGAQIDADIAMPLHPRHGARPLLAWGQGEAEA